MSKSLVTLVHFPITPINTNFANSLRKRLYRAIVNPRLSDTEELWLEHTTEHATQFDIVCYKFATLEEAAEYAEEFADLIAQEVAAWIAEQGADALADIW
jgi:hypothetical protein